jgi:hypothetical protein
VQGTLAYNGSKLIKNYRVVIVKVQDKSILRIIILKQKSNVCLSYLSFKAFHHYNLELSFVGTYLFATVSLPLEAMVAGFKLLTLG